MVYVAKPQRGGNRPITANTNNPPQDPPSPQEPLSTSDVFIPIPNTAIPIPNTAPLSPEIVKLVEKTYAEIPNISLRSRINTNRTIWRRN